MTTRERLIDAAASLLDGGGEAAVTLRAVGQAAGVSHNAPYRHFADRAALLAAVAERDFARLTEAFDAIDRSEGEALAKVGAALDAFVAYGEGSPARYRLLFGDPDVASRGGTLEAAALGTFAAFGALVGKARAGGGLPALDTAALTGLIVATAHGLLDLQAGGRLRAEKGAASVRDGIATLLRLLEMARGR